MTKNNIAFVTSKYHEEKFKRRGFGYILKLLTQRMINYTFCNNNKEIALVLMSREYVFFVLPGFADEVVKLLKENDARLFYLFNVEKPFEDKLYLSEFLRQNSIPQPSERKNFISYHDKPIISTSIIYKPRFEGNGDIYILYPNGFCYQLNRSRNNKNMTSSLVINKIPFGDVLFELDKRNYIAQDYFEQSDEIKCYVINDEIIFAEKVVHEKELLNYNLSSRVNVDLTHQERIYSQQIFGEINTPFSFDIIRRNEEDEYFTSFVIDINLSFHPPQIERKRYLEAFSDLIYQKALSI